MRFLLDKKLMAAILKIYFSLLSWIERLINLKLGRKHQGGLSRCWSYTLLLCGLFYEAICFSFAWCYFILVFFSPFSIRITSLGEEGANLSVLFDLRLFGFVCFLFLLVSGKAAACNCGTPWIFFYLLCRSKIVKIVLIGDPRWPP